jgi:hypothetical protein
VRPREFLLAVPDRVRPLLPDEHQRFDWVQRWSLVKLWYGNPKLHYEVWFHTRIQRVEIGLHFESDAATNERLRAFFEENLLIAKAEVSERVEAEGWDKGWARVYEMVPLRPLDDAFLDEVAGRLVHFITTLQPLLEDAIG